MALPVALTSSDGPGSLTSSLLTLSLRLALQDTTGSLTRSERTSSAIPYIIPSPPENMDLNVSHPLVPDQYNGHIDNNALRC